jgi:hypothetical protein
VRGKGTIPAYEWTESVSFLVSVDFVAGRLKWNDLDYERQMICLRRVWVGKTASRGRHKVPRAPLSGHEPPR